jgi:hypothetical protein
MPNYSEAPRGLFVLVEVGRVFTANAISPSKGLRQLLARYAIRAGHQLSDKELRSIVNHLINTLVLYLHASCKSLYRYKERTISCLS